MTVNIPEVVAEVRGLFERYEQALIDKNVEVLDATFWDSPHTIRYAFQENGYGFAQIHAHRVARPVASAMRLRGRSRRSDRANRAARAQRSVAETAPDSTATIEPSSSSST